MAYSVLTEQALLELAEGSADTPTEKLEQALDKAESKGFTFVGIDRSSDGETSYIFHSAGGKLRLGNIR